jgi:hypothetical protein
MTSGGSVVFVFRVLTIPSWSWYCRFMTHLANQSPLSKRDIQHTSLPWQGTRQCAGARKSRIAGLSVRSNVTIPFAIRIPFTPLFLFGKVSLNNALLHPPRIDHRSRPVKQVQARDLHFASRQAAKYESNGRMARGAEITAFPSSLAREQSHDNVDAQRSKITQYTYTCHSSCQHINGKKDVSIKTCNEIN